MTGCILSKDQLLLQCEGIETCETGNCKGTDGRSRLECGGVGSDAPVIKGEMNLDDTDDWYDVSWVDGFNVAMVVEATHFDAVYQAAEPIHHCASASVPSWDVRTPAQPTLSGFYLTVTTIRTSHEAAVSTTKPGMGTAAPFLKDM